MSKIVSLSEAASIGIHGIILIARSKDPMNVVHISERTGTSKHHVAKVMQRLSKAGFISSRRGPAGGFYLRKKPGEISFLDIYESIEGPVETQKCPMNKEVCPFEKCIMNNVMSQMTDDFRDYLAGQRISEYVGG